MATIWRWSGRTFIRKKKVEKVAWYLLLTGLEGGLDMTKLRLAVLPLAIALLFFVGVGSPKVLAAPLGNSTTSSGTATCGNVIYTFLLPLANDHAAAHVLSASDGSNVNNLILANLSGSGFGFPPHGQQTGLQGSILSGCHGTVTIGSSTFAFTADLFAVPR
jgi:hypothetical protein